LLVFPVKNNPLHGGAGAISPNLLGLSVVARRQPCNRIFLEEKISFWVILVAALIINYRKCMVDGMCYRTGGVVCGER